MSVLEIRDLRVAVRGREILSGVDLTVRSGEVHAVMGPNGSGKSTLSHVLLGKPGYEVLGGSVTLDGDDLLALPTWQRAQAGLFLAVQFPVEVPGVSLEAALGEALAARGEPVDGLRDRLVDEAGRIAFDVRFLDRPLNVDLSGGERKRNETVQLGVLRPRIAILDELDSGLDVDALRACARRVLDLARTENLGVLAITHFARLLAELPAEHVHILVKGRIVASGGPELADRLESEGYAAFSAGVPAAVRGRPATAADPFADPFAGR